MDDSIVVGTDGSDTAKQAVYEAVRLAKALGAHVHVVSAFEPTRGARVTGLRRGPPRSGRPSPTTTWRRSSARPQPAFAWPASR
jgi:nucleotide-binding universal stress UspA family protein